MHAAHIGMASAQYAVAAHSHAHESKQPGSTTSYPVREQSSMASRKCRPGPGHPVREYAGTGHDPQRLTLLNKGPGLPGRGQRVRAQNSLHEPNWTDPCPCITPRPVDAAQPRSEQESPIWRQVSVGRHAGRASPERSFWCCQTESAYSSPPAVSRPQRGEDHGSEAATPHARAGGAQVL